MSLIQELLVQSHCQEHNPSPEGVDGKLDSVAGSKSFTPLSSSVSDEVPRYLIKGHEVAILRILPQGHLWVLLLCTPFLMLLITSVICNLGKLLNRDAL